MRTTRSRPGKGPAADAAPVVGGAQPSSSVPVGIALLLRAVLATLARGVLALQASVTITRSSVLLIAFLVVHMCGNLSALGGKSKFNAYADAMAANPLLKAVEGYLLLAFVVHAAAGLLLSYRKRGYIRKAPVERGGLFVSSLLATAFIVLHVGHFRLSELQWTSTGLSGLGLHGGRDLFTMAQALLASRACALGYVGGTLALVAHLLLGWERAVRKIGLPAHAVRPHPNSDPGPHPNPGPS